MITSMMLWNEPNNLSHWDFQMDPQWQEFRTMVKHAARTIRQLAPHLTLVLGGISPIDPNFIKLMISYGTLDDLGVIEWFDHQMNRLKDFDVTLTLCFTPPSRGRRSCYTSPPVDLEEFARFAAEIVQRYVLSWPEVVPARGERSLYEQNPTRDRRTRQLCQQPAPRHRVLQAGLAG